MPAFTEANVRHLLRRTEVVDRPDRVDALMGTGSISAAVADVMSVRADPPSASFAGVADSNWRSGIRISEHWLDQMATITRPFGERMAFFWHGHICSELGKINSAVEMQQQIDLFRRSGVNGNISALVKEAAIQVAMLKYLDNDRNYKDSPNQNFARELMELFLLGVGNYTEADVEAATAAWTGHGRPRWDVNEYRYEPEQHDTTPQTFLGQRINDGTGEGAANETIDVILGTGGKRTGTVPAGAEINRNMDTNIVAADFLSKKLWQEFGEAASGGVPSGVAAAMRSALIDSGFDIRPWVTAMLNHDDFYAESTKTGLVRQPVEYSVALLVATGLSASDGAPLYLLDRAGQQPLYPPNVSGWKPNGYWVNASAMGARQELANSMLWRTPRRQLGW